MRRPLIIFNALITLCFLGAFIYTFVAKAHLTSVAREFAASKTADYAKPLVDLAEEASQSKTIKMALSKSKEIAIANEFTEYRADSTKYILEIIAKAPSDHLKLADNTLTKKLHSWKTQIRKHYDKILSRIANDLRIFTGTNFAAGLISLILVIRARGEIAQELMALSGILCLATCISIYGYLETFSFYQYLFNWQMGWSYPAFLSLTYLYLLVKMFRHRST